VEQQHRHRTRGGSSYTYWSIVQFILLGIFDRFPDLQIYFAESGISSIPAWLERADKNYLRRRDWTAVECKEMPSTCVRRRCHFGFQDDRYGVVHRDEIGVGRLLFTNDFPTVLATGPTRGR